MDDDLRYALDNGIIDARKISQQVAEMRRKELIAKHPYKPYCGSDGYWHVYMPSPDGNRVLRGRRTKNEIEDLIAEYWQAKIENPTVKEIFCENERRKLQLNKIQPSSAVRHETDFNRFFKNLQNRRIKNIEPEEWTDFLEVQLAEHNLTAKAFAGLKAIVRSILKRAKRKNLIDYDITAIFNDLDVSDQEFGRNVKEDAEDVFGENETKLVMAELRRSEDILSAGLILMFVTGLRVGEMSALKHEDINAEKNTINVRRTQTRGKIDGKWVYYVKDFPKTRAGIREVVVPAQYKWLVAKLYWISASQEYVFEKNGVRCQSDYFRKRLYRICKTIGIPKRGTHCIRKTYGSILQSAGIDDRIVIRQMGHTSIAVSEMYYHKDRKTIEQKEEIISSIPEFKTMTL